MRDGHAMRRNADATAAGAARDTGRGVRRGAEAPRTPLPGCPAPLLPSPGLRSDPAQCNKSSPKVTLTQTIPKRSPKVTLTQALQVRHMPPNSAPGAPHPVPAASRSIRAKAPHVVFLVFFVFWFGFLFFLFIGWSNGEIRVTQFILQWKMKML